MCAVFKHPEEENSCIRNENSFLIHEPDGGTCYKSSSASTDVATIHAS